MQPYTLLIDEMNAECIDSDQHFEGGNEIGKSEEVTSVGFAGICNRLSGFKVSEFKIGGKLMMILRVKGMKREFSAFLVMTMILTTVLAFIGLGGPTVYAAGNHDIYVNAYTAANDQNADGAGIQSAINDAIIWKNSHPNDAIRVIFDAGTYILNQNKNRIDIAGAKDLTIMGQIEASGKPGTLIQTNFGQAGGFKINGGSNIKVQNFSWEISPNWYTIAQVIAKDSGSVTVNVMNNTTADTSTALRSSPSQTNVPAMTLFDKDKMMAGYGQNYHEVNTWESPYWGTDNYILYTSQPGKKWSLVSGYTSRMVMNDTKLPTEVEVGNYIFWKTTMPSEYYPFSAEDVDGLTIENQYCYNFGNFYLSRVNNPTLKDIDLGPKFDRGWNGFNLGDIYGTPWFLNCSGIITVDHFRGSASRDDFMNNAIKGKPVVAKPAANQVILSDFSNGYEDPSKIYAGDTIEFYKNTADHLTDLTMTLAGSPQIYKYDWNNDGKQEDCWLLTFTSNIPSGFDPLQTLFAFPSKYGHTAEIYRNVESNSLKQAEMLLHNGVLIDNSVINSNVNIRSDVEWYEGSFPHDIEMKNSRFYDMGIIKNSLNHTLLNTDRPYFNINIHDNVFLPLVDIYSWSNDKTSIRLDHTLNGYVNNNRFSDATEKFVDLTNNNTNVSESNSSILAKGTTENFPDGNLNGGMSGWTTVVGSGIGIENESGSNRLMFPAGNIYSEARKVLTGLKPDTYYFLSSDAKVVNGHNGTNKIFLTVNDVMKGSSPFAAASQTSYTKMNTAFKTGPDANNWKDYTFTADVIRYSGVETALLAKYAAPNKYYQLVMKDNVIQIDKNDGGSWSTIATANYTFTNYNWYNLKFELNGNSLKGYVNGNLVVQGTDATPFAIGGIALKNHNSEAAFDNVAVMPMERTAKVMMSDDFNDGTAVGWTAVSGNWSTNENGTPTYRNTGTSGEAITTYNNTSVKLKAWRFGGTNKAYLDNFSVKELIGVESNLGLNKGVSTDSNAANYNATNSNDGNASTAWKANNSNAGHSLTIDLSNEYYITGVDSNWLSQTSVYKYYVEISNDGTNWKKVIDKSGNTIAEAKSRLMFDSEKRAKFVRITFTSGSAQPGINEFAVLGM
ncbi:discoidin domain-containing protein [Paenibacillus sp. Soil750]|uniref:discoidin domain-containing protein n=1 Tax=Paenibacillus sp. Soil750 TaxID=1736398 RepID=UPI0006FE5551|nr:discoidin domain-containing protein [Paenibacillus sp. Soil750]KRE69746.1 hypothetical protein ASL11_15385 [Paenibacillus sp. Soil750]